MLCSLHPETSATLGLRAKAKSVAHAESVDLVGVSEKLQSARTEIVGLRKRK